MYKRWIQEKVLYIFNAIIWALGVYSIIYSKYGHYKAVEFDRDHLLEYYWKGSTLPSWEV